VGITDAIGRVFRIRRSRHGTDFYDLAERERRVPEAEMVVAEAVLAGGGPLAERALRQLRETPEVSRLRAEDGSYEMRIVTFDNLTIRGVPRAGWTSVPIPVETTDGRRMELESASSRPASWASPDGLTTGSDGRRRGRSLRRALMRSERGAHGSVCRRPPRSRPSGREPPI
jgi:hypothetical protein